MQERTCYPKTWTTPFLLLLLLLHANTGYAAASTSSDVPSTSVSASASANHRSTRSADPANSPEGEDEEKNACSSDFVEKFFRLLSGPVGKEGEALVAAVVKILSENDRVNWPAMADWSATQSRDVLPASTIGKLRQIFLDGSRSVGGNEKRMAPKFNPTGWRRKRSTSRMAAPLDPLLQALLAKYDTPALLGDNDYAPKTPEDYALPSKMAQFLDAADVKLVPEIPEWQPTGKRSSLPGRVSRRHPSQRLPKRKPLEFNPTGW